MPNTACFPTRSRPPATIAAPALLLAVAVAGVGAVWARQAEVDYGAPSEAVLEISTVEGILNARKEGRPPAEIVARIEETGVSFDLSLDEALGLRARGLEPEILGAMNRMPADRVTEILSIVEDAQPPPGRRRGLSRRAITKMIERGTPETEILAAIAREGSKASLSLNQADALRSKGASPVLLRAIVTGSVPAAQPTPVAAAPPRAPSAQAVPPPPAAAAARGEPPQEAPLPDDLLAEGGEEEAPLLDDLLAEEEEEEAPLLDDLLAQEEEEEAYDEEAWEEEGPLLDDLLAEEAEARAEAARYLNVLADMPGARVLVAPATARPVDLLKQSRSVGRTPARIALKPGVYFVLVEKQADEFDRSIIPAIRTVHDLDGATRTVIVSGDIYYEAARCCLPRSLGSEVAISRTQDDTPGVLLGDEFDGLPPYLWDGNRFLILSLREGRIERVVKVYRVRKASYEPRTLVATFVPASADPLSVVSPNGLEPSTEEAARVWEPLLDADLQGVGRIFGIAQPDLDRLAPLLNAYGKATWRQVGQDGALSLVTFSLDTRGRARVEEVTLRRDGPYGMFSTPAPPPPPKKRGKKTAPPPAPPALPIPVQEADPEIDLPVLVVENTTQSGALLRSGDGTFLYVPPGESREVTVVPGTFDLEARFESRPGEVQKGRTRFSHHARYRLQLS